MHNCVCFVGSGSYRCFVWQFHRWIYHKWVGSKTFTYIGHVSVSYWVPNAKLHPVYKPSDCVACNSLYWEISDRDWAGMVLLGCASKLFCHSIVQDYLFNSCGNCVHRFIMQKYLPQNSEDLLVLLLSFSWQLVYLSCIHWVQFLDSIIIKLL